MTAPKDEKHSPLEGSGASIGVFPPCGTSLYVRPQDPCKTYGSPGPDHPSHETCTRPKRMVGGRSASHRHVGGAPEALGSTLAQKITSGVNWSQSASWESALVHTSCSMGAVRRDRVASPL